MRLVLQLQQANYQAVTITTLAVVAVVLTHQLTPALVDLVEVEQLVTQDIQQAITVQTTQAVAVAAVTVD
jgi:hypothetical protein